MRILLPTGAATAEIVRRAAVGFDADVVVTGKIASFLTPRALRDLIVKGDYNAVVVSGMCTVSFEQVERETGVPVYRGPGTRRILQGSSRLSGKSRSRARFLPRISLLQERQGTRGSGWRQRKTMPGRSL